MREKRKAVLFYSRRGDWRTVGTQHELQRKRNNLERTLQPALVLMFVLYPKVSAGDTTSDS